MSHQRSIDVSWAGLLLAAVTGCNQAVDLDRRIGLVTPSSDPLVLGATTDRVVQLLTDDHRLYWSTDAGALRGCEAQNCAGTVTTYAESGAEASAGVVLNGGELFFVGDGGDSTALLAVDVEHQTQRQLLQPTSHVYSLAADALGACLAHYPNAVTCIGLGENSTPVLILTPDTEPCVLTTHRDAVYWLATTDGHGVLQRARRDGSGEVETLMGGLRLYTRQDTGDAAHASSIGLAVDDEFVYFSENVLSGSLQRRALTGRNPASESLLAPLRTPSAVWLDGTSLYAQHELEAYHYAVSSCDPERCAERLVIDPLASKRAFAVGRHHVYAATIEPSLVRPHASPPSPPAVSIQLRRFPR